MRIDDKSNLRSVSGLFFILGIVADLATVGLYLNNLFKGTIPFNIDSAFPWISIIIVIFLFSLMLLTFSKNDSDILDVIRWLFGWVYVIFAALLFAVISNQFIFEANYGIYEYFGYIVLVILISGLGFIITNSSSQYTNSSSRYFSVPFMIVGLYQTILWLNILYLNPQAIVFNLTFLGNLLLFVVSASLISFCLRD